LSGDGLFLGSLSGDPPARLEIDPSDLTTHGVAVGMTGSGKTGLLIALIEEALRHGIPAVVLDPKGDLANLFLTFPSLEARDFAPWVDPQEAQRAGVTVDDLAAQTAARWTEGLGRDGLGRDQIHELREKTVMRLFTPGSDAGLPVNVLSVFDPPELSWDSDAEVIRERIAAAVSALLSRAGEEADPLQSPSHIFLANLLEDRWRAGEHPGLEDILGYLRQARGSARRHVLSAGAPPGDDAEAQRVACQPGLRGLAGGGAAALRQFHGGARRQDPAGSVLHGASG
jgi:hypothetical protein